MKTLYIVFLSFVILFAAPLVLAEHYASNNLGVHPSPIESTATPCPYDYSRFTLSLAVQLPYSLPDGSKIETGYYDFNTVSASGEVAFNRKITNSPRDTGIFVARDNQVREIVRGCSAGGCGDPAPGGGKFKWVDHGGNHPQINSRGDIVFLGFVEGQTPYLALYYYSKLSGTIVPIAKEGQTIIGGETLIYLSYANLNDHGVVAFYASFASNPSQKYIVTWKNGIYTVRLQEGYLTSDGSTLTNITTFFYNDNQGYAIYTESPFINNRNEIAFAGKVSKNGEEHEAILLQRIAGGSPQVVVKNGDPVPKGKIDFFYWPTLNDRGEILFLGAISDSPLGYGDHALFIASPDSGSVIPRIRYLQNFEGFEDQLVSNVIEDYSPQRSIDNCGNVRSRYLWQTSYLVGNTVGIVAPNHKLHKLADYALTNPPQSGPWTVIGMLGNLTNNGRTIVTGEYNGVHGIYVATAQRR